MSPVIEKYNNLIDRLLTSQILIGLDVGFKTIGIAVSDSSLTIADPVRPDAFIINIFKIYVIIDYS